MCPPLVGRSLFEYSGDAPEKLGGGSDGETTLLRSSLRQVGRTDCPNPVPLKTGASSTGQSCGGRPRRGF
eukprot:CAMPEP_0115364814 /NCGR_PEP_ID=MMETSP0270-20121206/103963_1 /TAXON_ID=71861 /ORGANISM="Scrippsiella trochoidea, Strain CCMP3099" /LENGTH=69 /DNA_ID=CAMNT_0002787525 /DNA_START=322 /DNA_END=531 /DNA_ORIENTATION=+